MKKLLLLLTFIIKSLFCMEINNQLKQACAALELLAKKFPFECTLSHMLAHDRVFCDYVAWDMQQKIKQCNNQEDITKFHPDYRICILEEKAILLKNITLITPRAQRCIEKAEL